MDIEKIKANYKRMTPAQQERFRARVKEVTAVARKVEAHLGNLQIATSAVEQSLSRQLEILNKI
jgi:hypothetical protein